VIGLKTGTTILLVALLVISIVCRNYEPAYFVGDALCWVIALQIIVLNTAGKQKIIAQGILLLTVSNLLDEVIFDPTTTGINEWVFFALVAIWSIKRFYKHVRRT
jgi:hypothetical protein